MGEGLSTNWPWLCSSVGEFFGIPERCNRLRWHRGRHQCGSGKFMAYWYDEVDSNA